MTKLPGSEAAWPLTFPGTNWQDNAEMQAVRNVLEEGSLFRYYGPGTPTHVAQLEEQAKAVYGVRHALAVNSGTGALMTTLVALGIGPGCEVILPPFLWVATVSAVVQANAIPVLCEVDNSFTIDPEDLDRKITPRTKLIVAIHMAGVPCDMDAVMDVANRHGIPVVEDCAQANGASFGGRSVGTFGALGVFSFQINKNVTAGEGGLIVTNDDDLHLRAVAAHDIGVPWINGVPDDSRGVNIWGQGRRMSELCGAVANVQLDKLRQVVGYMRASKQRIRKQLEGIPGLGFRRLHDPEGDSGPFLVLVFENAQRATDVLAKLSLPFPGAGCRLIDYGMHIYCNIPALAEKAPLSSSGNPWSLAENQNSVYDYAKGACPASDALFERSVILPIPSRLSVDQEDAVASAIRKAVETA